MAEDFLNLPSKSGQDIANLALQQIANTLGVTTDALASAVNLANTAGNNANAKILDLETRWNDLTTKQQQDAEVIDARKGKASLKAKIDELESQSNEIATDLDTHKVDYTTLLNSGYGSPMEVETLNGWTSNIEFTKNKLGQIFLYGRLNIGVMTVGTKVANIPSGYKSNALTVIATLMRVSPSPTRVIGYLRINTSLQTIQVLDMLEGATIGDNVRFTAMYQGSEV